MKKNILILLAALLLIAWGGYMAYDRVFANEKVSFLEMKEDLKKVHPDLSDEELEKMFNQYQEKGYIEDGCSHENGGC